MGQIFSAQQHNHDNCLENEAEIIEVPVNEPSTYLDLDTRKTRNFELQGEVLHLRIEPIEDDIDTITNDSRVPPLYDLCVITVLYHVLQPCSDQIAIDTVQNRIKRPYPHFSKDEIDWDPDKVSGAALDDMMIRAMQWGWIEEEFALWELLSPFAEYLDLSPLVGGATDAMVETVCENCPDLVCLNLTGSQKITRNAISSICSLTQLETLYLGGTLLTDDDIDEDLFNMTSLKRLVLSNTLISSDSLERMFKSQLEKVFVALCSNIYTTDVQKILRKYKSKSLRAVINVQQAFDEMKLERERMEKAKNEWWERVKSERGERDLAV